jgi:hypothetical protein
MRSQADERKVMDESRQRNLVEARQIESVEREAWLDLFGAAPAGYAMESGVTCKRLGNAAALAHCTVPIVEFNRVFAAGLTEPWSRDQFEIAMDWLQRHAAAGWAIQISPAIEPSEVTQWAEERGLHRTGTGWAKWRRLAGPIGAQSARTDLEIRCVDHTYAAEFGNVVHQGFGLPEATVAWFSALPGRPGWSTYLAFDNDRAVAAAAMFMREGWAWLGVDTTLAHARSRGAQSSLIARRLSDGLSAGVVGFTAETAQPRAGEEAAHTSFRNYGKAGFSLAYVRPNYKVRQPN